MKTTYRVNLNVYNDGGFNKVAAIKLVRHIFDADLKTAKEVVEAHDYDQLEVGSEVWGFTMVFVLDDAELGRLAYYTEVIDPQNYSIDGIELQKGLFARTAPIHGSECADG